MIRVNRTIRLRIPRFGIRTLRFSDVKPSRPKSLP